jgi:hypothetical protein
MPELRYPRMEATGIRSPRTQDFPKHFAGSSVIRTSVPGIPLAVHTFTRTRDIIKEIIDARIYGGMHYRTSAVHGIVIANQVAHWVSRHHFQPVP